MKTLFFITFIFSVLGQAQSKAVSPINISEPIAIADSSLEKWVRFTCRGPITPKGKTPIVYQDVMVAHFRSTSTGLPTATSLYDQNWQQLQNVTDLCTARRWQQADLAGWTGNAGHTTYLDWETDHLYERYLISSVEFDPKITRRGIGSPCDKQATCVGRSDGTTQIVCNEITNTCESKTVRSIVSPNETIDNSIRTRN